MVERERSLLEQIETREAKIAVIGLGYVGLPLVIEFCGAGFPVIGLDIDEEKVKLLREGKSYIKHIDAAKIKGIGTKFEASSDFSRLSETDCIIICVPTPLNRNREQT